MQALFGLIVFTAAAWAISENRRAALNARVIVAGLSLQFLIALLLIKVPAATDAFAVFARAVSAAQESARVGAEFVFGYLSGGAPPFETTDPAAVFLLAFQALPLVLIVSVISALLFHWGILPAIVRGMGRLLSRSMKVGGEVGVGAAANIFVGQIEAGLFIRPYIATLSRADLFAFMTTGLATIAGTVLALYGYILEPIVPGAFGHLLTASLISAPAAIMIARVICPTDSAHTDARKSENENNSEKDSGGGAVMARRRISDSENALDALVVGAADGAKLLTRIIAMLIVTVGLAHLCNTVLALAPEVGGSALSLERMLGWLMSPLAWCMGIPWSEAIFAGELLGVKIILNEFVAYVRMAEASTEAAEAGLRTLSARSALIMSYAMAGFASLAGAGVLIGGIGAMASHRRAEIAALGMKSLLAGNFATMMTGAVAGIVSGL